MNKSILMASLIAAVALAACGKKEEAPAPMAAPMAASEAAPMAAPMAASEAAPMAAPMAASEAASK